MYISGIATGLDTETLIQQLMAIERRPLVMMQERKNLLQQQRDAWRDINTRLNTLRERMADLSRTGLYERRSAISSEEGVVTVSANGDAAEARYNIVVEQLARAHRVASEQFASDVTFTGSGKIVVAGEELELSFTEGVTLQEIAEAVNDAEVAVTARVIDGHLVVQSDETGDANKLQFEGGLWQALGITSDANGTFAADAVLQEARDAVFKIEGLTVTRSSNTVDDVVEGVTFTLRGAGEAAVDIERDADAVVDAVRRFVEQYNSTMSFIQSRSADGELQGDTLLMRIAFQLRSDATSPVDGADPAYNQLAAVGITVDRHGTMSLNETKLREALAENTEAVQTLFTATQEDDGFDGVAARLESRFQAWLAAGDGLLAARQKMFGDRMKAIDDSIEQMERRLEIRERNLMRQFAALEEVMASFQTQASWLAGQINQMNMMTAAAAQPRG